MTLRLLIWTTCALGVGCGTASDTDTLPDSDTVIDSDTDSDTDTDSGAQGDPELGRLTFAATCASAECHGPDGVSGPEPDLTAVVPFYSDERLSAIIQNGAGRMPGQPVSDDELVDLLAYLRQSFP